MGERKKCGANVSARDCFYKKDMGTIKKRFTQIDEKLHEIAFVKLNGDGEETHIQTVMKDIWIATRSQRATKGLSERYAIWKRDTAIGRFIGTRGGRILSWFVWAWVIIGSTNTLGLTDIKLNQMLEAFIRYVFRSGG